MILLADLAKLDLTGLKAHIQDNYAPPADWAKGIRFIVAYESVGTWGCDSSSVFIFHQQGKVWIVEGSHCSCYGFEGQWRPQETHKKALLAQKYFSMGGYDDARDENEAAIRAAIQKMRRTS